MKYVQALIALGLFIGLAYGVYSGTMIGGNSSKSRALSGFVEAAVAQFGTTATSVGLVVAGVLLAALFLVRREEA